MSFGGSGGGSSGGGGTVATNVQPYAAAQPALNQIISEAGNIYGSGVGGYVAPTQQTLTGLAQQETLGNAAQTQLQNTLAGNYANPYLNPLIQQAAGTAYTNVAQQFSGAGRTPGSPVSQQLVAQQVAQTALPYAFNAAEAERGRQLNVAQTAPSLVQTGQQLEQLQSQAQQSPFQNLQQYAGIVSPIASGFPVQNQQTQTQTNPLTTAAGGAAIGYGIGGGMGSLYGAGLGYLGGLL
jgi:hypothetical protein